MHGEFFAGTAGASAVYRASLYCFEEFSPYSGPIVLQYHKNDQKLQDSSLLADLGRHFAISGDARMLPR